MSEPPPRRCLAIVLAAGEGTRMRSALPKPLHAVAGRSMLGHVMAAAASIGADAIAVVVGPGREDVAQQARAIAPHALIVVQAERRGTAHAVLTAREALAEGFDDVLVLYADVPLVTAETLQRLRRPLTQGAAVAVLGFEARDPAGYGRLIIGAAGLVAIREQKDATAAERAVTTCNSGLMALDGQLALRLLDGIGCDNAQGEFYLTDVVEAGVRAGLRSEAVSADEAEVMGVNDRVQLAAVEDVMQRRLREAAMRNGATLIAPETVFLSHDTLIGRDVIVEPHVVLAPKVRIGDNVVIHAFSHLEGASIEPGASVGPFARLRPGAAIGMDAKVGNFVEVKNATVAAGAKISHLSYIGDADVGAAANIGAGTITCNYDGYNKARTTIGAEAFIGSNTALVAPVTVGPGAFIGSGSVITEDVEADALALGRGRQVNKPGRAAVMRTEMKAKKAAGRPS